MDEAFDPIESHQRTTNVLIGKVRTALGREARRSIQDSERCGGTMRVCSWPSGELSVEVTNAFGAVVMVFWVVTRNGVGVLIDPPTKEA